MNCSCCPPGNINDLDKTFNAARAAADARDYLKNGLGKRGRKLIHYLLAAGGRPFTVLDVGCGAGAAHHELLRHGAAGQAIGVDASSAFLAVAAENAARLGLAAAATYHHADFALQAGAFEPADVVLMDRVICCYPHLQQLLGAAAAHTHRYLALTFPLDRWWLRLPVRLVDGFLTLFGSGYHPYVHRHADVIAIAAAAGLHPVHRDRSTVWQIMVFARP
jgi:magnesium-protoporphyrin O-methyltransferase